MKVLIESSARKGRGDLMGRTECYRKVIFPGKQDLIGKIVTVTIKDVSSTILKGALI